MLEQASHESRNRTLGEIVEEFELTWNVDGNADVVDFLPSPDDPAFERVALELLRVDLERRWRSGHAKTVEQYLRQFPELLHRSDLIEQLAYEEYRLLREHGEPVVPADYARRLRVTTHHWPSDLATDSTPLVDDTDQPKPRDLPAEIWPCGDQFLDFELVELLGRGDLGEVYLARQPDLADRLVVLKITTERWCESDRLARLSHPNVVPIYSVHQQGDLQAACMPYLGRHTLRSVFKAAGDRTSTVTSDLVDVFAPAAYVKSNSDDSVPNPSHRVLDHLRSLSFEHFCLWIMSRISAGLSHAHERGILHRDLKPANILLTDDGQPMILDFNLSETMSSQRAIVVGGTLPYMAPEHLRAISAGSRIDARSDIYSLGVILFQMLTGRLPFSIHENMDVEGLEAMIAERSVAPAAPSSLNARVTPAIDEIVKRCLAPDPKHRYLSAEELQEDLDCQLAHQPLRHATNRSVAERATKWIRRHPRAAAALGVLTISTVVLAVTFTLLLRSGDKVAELQTKNQHGRFIGHVQEALPALFMLDESELVDSALKHVDQALNLYDVRSENWQQTPKFQLLDQRQQNEARELGRELFYLLARQALNRSDRLGDPQQKTEMLNHALSHNQIAMRIGTDGTSSPSIVRQQATIRASLGHADKAARLNKRADSLAADDRLDQLVVAVQRMESREFKQAERLLLALDQDWPKDFTIWYLRGKNHFAAGDMPRAIGCFVTCETLRPESASARFQRGQCHWWQEDYDAAEQAYAEAIGLDADEPTFFINRAMARMKQARLDLAIDDLTQAIHLGRDDSLPFLLRYRVHAAAGKVEQANQDLELGLHATPIDERGFNLRGVVRLRQKKDVAGALADFESALIIDPHSTKALQNSAYILWRKLGRHEEAIAALDTLLAADPDDWETRMKRVLLSATFRNREDVIPEARALAADAEKLVPATRAEVYYYVACSFAQASTRADDSQTADFDAREALKWLGKAVEIERRWADFAQIDVDFKPATTHEDFRALIDAAGALSDVIDRVAPAQRVDH